MTAKIVHIVEDEPLHANLLDRALRQAHFQTVLSGDGRSGWQELQRLAPSLILLDLMLPGISGHELCRLVRCTPSTSHVPIIMITAMVAQNDCIAGLEMGADDYVTKPFSPREVVARVEAVLRRSAARLPTVESLCDANVTVRGQLHLTTWRGREFMLSSVELTIFRYLLVRIGELVETKDLLEGGMPEQGMQPGTIQQSIRILGRKLQNSGAASIEVLPGSRYRLQAHP